MEPQRVMPSELPSASRWQAQAPAAEPPVVGALGWSPAAGVASQAAATDDEALYIDPLHIVYGNNFWWPVGAVLDVFRWKPVYEP